MPDPIMIDDLYQLGWIEEPALSPDGRWVAYVRVSVDRAANCYRRTIWLCSTQGGSPLRLTAGPRSDTAPCWSPDGSYIGFLSDRAGKPQLHVIRRDGGEARAITRLPEGVSAAAWSPDGRQLAFLSSVDLSNDETAPEVRTPDESWEQEQRKAQRARDEARLRDPMVISRLPYRSGVAYFDQRRLQVFVVELPANDEDSLKPVRRLTNEDVHYSAPAWMPDGSALLSTVTRDPEADSLFAYYDVMRIPIPDQGFANPERITSHEYSCFNPQPSPDGRMIAFQHRPDNQTFAAGMRLALIETRDQGSGIRDQGSGDAASGASGDAGLGASVDEGFSPSCCPMGSGDEALGASVDEGFSPSCCPMGSGDAASGASGDEALGASVDEGFSPSQAPSYHAEAKPWHDLSSEADLHVEQFCWKADSSGLLFTAGFQGEQAIYTASPEPATAIKPLFEANQRVISDIDVASDGTLVYVAGSAANPCELFVRDPNGTERQISRLHEEFLTARDLVPIEELRYTAPDGAEVQGWVLYPPGFAQATSGQTFPLAVHIHGGPHLMWGPGIRSMWHEFQVNAAHGYVTFFCNPRGSDGYGLRWRDGVHGDWGSAAQDILAGIDMLLAKHSGYIDERRIAVTGGSYGGYMTAWLLGHSRRFACGVAARGVYDLVAFHGTSDAHELIELEFDGYPWEVGDLLWQQSPLAYAHQIETPLLILHSEQDYRVPISQAEQLFSVLRRRKIPVELVRYPREGHELTRTGEPLHRADHMRRTLEWFDRYCGDNGKY